MGLHPAGASLIGMPLNLKVALELHEVGVPAPACQFYTDDVYAGPAAGQGLLIAWPQKRARSRVKPFCTGRE